MITNDVAPQHDGPGPKPVGTVSRHLSFPRATYEQLVLAANEEGMHVSTLVGLIVRGWLRQRG